MRHIAYTMVWHSRSKVIGKKWEIFLEVCWHKIFAARSISRCTPQIIHSSWLIHVHFIELAWGNIVLAVVIVFFFCKFHAQVVCKVHKHAQENLTVGWGPKCNHLVAKHAHKQRTYSLFRWSCFLLQCRCWRQNFSLIPLISLTIRFHDLIVISTVNFISVLAVMEVKSSKQLTMLEWFDYPG